MCLTIYLQLIFVQRKLFRCMSDSCHLQFKHSDCSDKAQEFLIILWKERNSKPPLFKTSKMLQIHSEQLKCKFKTRKLDTGVRKIITCLTGFFETCFLCMQSSRVMSLLLGLVLSASNVHYWLLHPRERIPGGTTVTIPILSPTKNP